MSSRSKGVSGVILNGGRSRRMNGADKARLVVGGKRIIETQLALLGSRCSHVAMVVADASQAEGLAVQTLYDRVGGQGPLDGIAAALAWATTPWVLVLACDMPGIRPELLDLLVDAMEDSLDVVAMAPRGRVQPLVALYHQRLLPVLDRALAQGRLRASDFLTAPWPGVVVHFIKDAEIRQVDPENASFQNLNCPEDLSHR